MPVRYFAQTKIKGGKMLKVIVELEDVIDKGYRMEGKRIKRVQFSGDFFLHPEEVIEEIEICLAGLETEKNILLTQIEKTLRDANAEAVGVSASDFADIIMLALRSEPLQD
ncbi:MAG: lipoate protein ligase C-terminal domain-containing protein [Thermoplasmata archaeon]